MVDTQNSLKQGFCSHRIIRCKGEIRLVAKEDVSNDFREEQEKKNQASVDDLTLDKCVCCNQIISDGCSRGVRAAFIGLQI